MNLPFALFLAIKYLKPKRTFISVISVISILGVLLGVAILIIVLSVMGGFDDLWREKILGFDAHLTVTRMGVIEDEISMAAEIRDVKGVSGVAPFVHGLVFIQHKGVVFPPMMRGIDVEQEKKVSTIPQHMVAGHFAMEENEIIMGRELASRLGARMGDKILIYSPQSIMVSRDEISLPEEMTISGIYDVGMWEYDIGVILVPIAMARELYGMDEGIHGLKVMTHNPYEAGQVAHKIDARLRSCYPDVSVKTWMDLNRQLFSALRVEKNIMFFLLIFIVLVAAFGITNSLIIVVVQKTKEVGLLKALGFSSASIMSVFFLQSWIQGLIGTALGILTGLLMLQYRNDLLRWLSSSFNMELFPPKLYHLSEIPARVSALDVMLVALLSMFICTLAGLLPAYRAAKLDPVEALRHE